MDTIIPIALGLLFLAITLFIGSWLLLRYRGTIHNTNNSGELTVHKMLADLQTSWEKGDVSIEEYRVIKAELNARLREMMKS